MKKKILISIPAYNEANNIRPLYKKLNETLEKKETKLILKYYLLMMEAKITL
ncbi:TPA: hypothetical protein ACWL3Y_003176 [Enterococcus faecalis]|uniref:hypothetical protein n=1 Tax=Enterococcus faecalis TaxID=1351 RepID=UPI0001F0DE08|nr:hypothetical protein [Enterococcus faecalis]AHI41122.1 Hypothetical protein DENG_02207 [Enterococcus faecalis DENG1]EFU03524.1 hypothetical protein HMPREF9508_00777 [Enterococcus faecalis TX0312]ELA03803.1 hypothetical protein OG1X_0301 [Enterococcus faecalis OG1X]EOJ70548.1 hypothetical protein WMW_01725 [Enterococcus faecalis EnGen0352]EOJ92875.1 hypothetical protein WOG_02060 [Enterococcus faecalis EnGen0370]